MTLGRMSCHNINHWRTLLGVPAGPVVAMIRFLKNSPWHTPPPSAPHFHTRTTDAQQLITRCVQ
jgi:hypothetical protein